MSENAISRDDLESDDYIPVYSIKLINGDNILSEIEAFDSDEDGSGGIFTFVNPLIVELSSGKDGDMTYAREYDPMSDEEILDVHSSNLISKPSIVTDFYREFYVRALIYAMIKRIKFELSQFKDLPAAELDMKIMIANQRISEMVEELSLKFEMEIQTDSDAEYSPSDKRTLH